MQNSKLKYAIGRHQPWRIQARPVGGAREVVLEMLLGSDRLGQDAGVAALVLEGSRLDALQELDRVVIDLAPQVGVDGPKDAAELVVPAPAKVLR